MECQHSFDPVNSIAAAHRPRRRLRRRRRERRTLRCGRLPRPWPALRTHPRRSPPRWCAVAPDTHFCCNDLPKHPLSVFLDVRVPVHSSKQCKACAPCSAEASAMMIF